MNKPINFQWADIIDVISVHLGTLSSVHLCSVIQFAVIALLMSLVCPHDDLFFLPEMISVKTLGLEVHSIS